MFAVECTEACDGPNGKRFAVGDFHLDREAYLLCMPGYRNAAPRFKPADEATAAKVREEMLKREPVVDQTKAYLQTRIDAFAAAGRFEIDPATGFFKRDPDSVFLGKMTSLEMHYLETADGYGLKPAASL